MTTVQINFRKPWSILNGIQVGTDRSRGRQLNPANAAIMFARRPCCVSNDRIIAHPANVQPANPTQCASSLGPKPQAGFVPTAYIVAKGRVAAMSKPRPISITPRAPTAKIFPEFITRIVLLLRKPQMASLITPFTLTRLFIVWHPDAVGHSQPYPIQTRHSDFDLIGVWADHALGWASHPQSTHFYDRRLHGRFTGAAERCGCPSWSSLEVPEATTVHKSTLIRGAEACR
ncbi:hypothetical protein ALQ79_200304 [Pseudomonas amygdali pv. lachrymans]|nr:hypothetical protein ALQ79_200304 [Pseudomonas amygdali pv. lachrymans]